MLLSGSTGETCPYSGNYSCEVHPREIIKVKKDNQFPGCTWNDGHHTRWIFEEQTSVNYKKSWMVLSPWTWAVTFLSAAFVTLGFFAFGGVVDAPTPTIKGFCFLFAALISVAVIIGFFKKK